MEITGGVHRSFRGGSVADEGRVPSCRAIAAELSFANRRKESFAEVDPAGVLGRPVLYGTTRKFLQVFGLKSPRDLARAEQLRPAEGGPAAREPMS
jgi:hypothetical protein